MTLITGSAGFIGYHLTRKLAEEYGANSIIAIDNFNDYYPPVLKEARAAKLKDDFGIDVKRIDLTDSRAIATLFMKPLKNVVHLAAQAGVRYSIEQPRAYIDSNIVGFTNLLEAARDSDVDHILYASSSSVYGNNSPVPFREDHPLQTYESLYAVTKAANEMMAQVYAKLYGLKFTGLRFFTVYGSWGRPDMAYFSFTEDIRAGRPIQVFNNGKMERDFTHVSDIVEGIAKILRIGPDERDSGPAAVYNIGRGQPIPLLEFISTIEELIGRESEKILMPMQKGDVSRTWADVSALRRDYGYEPKTNLAEGLTEFVDWYKDYYGDAG
jgi:UDP-glucuronate 4-epimerase